MKHQFNALYLHAAPEIYVRLFNNAVVPIPIIASCGSDSVAKAQCQIILMDQLGELHRLRYSNRAVMAIILL